MKRKFLIWLSVIGLFIGTLTGGIFALFWDLPEIRSLETYRPPAITEIYSADNVLLTEFFAERREPVRLDHIPFYLKQGILTTEDRKFYLHSGIDVKSIFRAIIKDIIAGELVQGASTITQQLARTLFLTPNKNFVRKIKEAVISIQLERRYTKDEILEMYLNQIYFGSGAYGAESAAKLYFGKSVKDLDLAQCALLSAMPRSPSRYSPLVNPELALKRRNIVLMQMKDTDIITEKQYRDALKQPIAAENKASGAKAPYFTAYLKSFLEDILGPSRLYKGGIKVHTTLNFDMQQKAEEAVKKGIAKLNLRMLKNKIDTDYLQAAFIAIDVKTGKILAMVGGKDFEKSPFNRAVSALRQPGSAFKPILYAYAVMQGMPQNTIVLDAPVSFEITREKDWEPKNFSKGYKGEMTIRHALSLSKNIPAVRLIEKFRPESIAKFGKDLGITSELRPYLSLALGASEVKLIELTSAYCIFANRGEKIEPYCIEKVLENSRILWQASPSKKIVMQREDAAIMVDMLKGVIQEGTGAKAKGLKFPAAGKTGTTDSYRDALFIGFSPNIAAGVWVGNDNFEPLGNYETGAKAALPIWLEFMSKLDIDTAGNYFDMPDNMEKIKINPITGQKTADNDPKGVYALFRKEER